MATAKQQAQDTKSRLMTSRGLGSLLLITLGAIVLLISAFFIWGRIEAGLASQQLTRNVDLTQAELVNEVRRVYNLLASPPVVALATRHAEGDESAEQAVRELIQAQVPNILVLRVLPGSVEQITAGPPPQPGYAVLDMVFQAEEHGAAPAQVHFAGTERENLSFLQSIAGVDGIIAYIWLSVPTSLMTNQFKDYSVGNQYLALEQVTLRQGPTVLRSFGRAPGGRELKTQPIDGSMLRIVWYDSASLIMISTRELVLGVLLGLLLIIAGLLMLRRAGKTDAKAKAAAPVRTRSVAPKEDQSEVSQVRFSQRDEEQDTEEPVASEIREFVQAIGASPEATPLTMPDDSALVLHPGIFRAYDIRGVVGRTLDAATARAIGRAVASSAREQGGKQVVVARDGRLSGPELLAAVTDGILEAGCDVLDIGAAPTPVLYFAVHELDAGSGIMVTGSHNPPDYNGFKIMVNGQTLAGEEIQALRERIESKNFTSGKGQLIDHNVFDIYAQRIGTDIQIERPLKVVVDCGNGIAGVIAPRVLQGIGAQVTPLYSEVDGTFPNHHPDPSVPANLMDLKLCVRNFNADLGLAFDGDGDRLGVVTPSGTIIWPDELMMLFARDVLSRNPGSSIIYDVKCSSRLAQAIRDAGGRPLMWRTGHSLIKRKMIEQESPLAGEMSGHFFFKERWYGFDDAIYAACRLLEILALEDNEPGTVLEALRSGVSTPEIQVAMKEGRNRQFIDEFCRRAEFENAQVSTIDGLRADFPDGFGLVRASNTTPVLVLRFEGEDEASLQRIQRLFREQLLEINPYLELPF
ncbi:MAG: phosphomannomutase/phosphoglucomutase [Wenzhouxiangellaceae bacterium]